MRIRGPASTTRATLAALAIVFAATVSATGELPAPPQPLAPAIDAIRRGACEDTVGLLGEIGRKPAPNGPRAAYLLGRCLLSLGRYEESRQVFLDASQRHPTLSAHARLGAARAALLAGNAAGAIELSQGVPGASGAAAARLLLVRGEALLRIGEGREAAAIARALARGEHPDALLAEAWWLLGRAAESEGDRSAARSAFAMVWWGILNNPHAREAGQRLRRLSAGRDPVPTHHARAARGVRLIERWEFGGAERELAIAVKGPLPEPLAPEAWYQLGVLRLGTRAAISALEQAVRFSRDRDRALFWLGVAWLRRGDGAAARAVWSRLGREYRNSQWTARSIAVQGRTAEAAGRWQDADRLYAAVIERYPASPRADDARWRRAWGRLQRGQSAEARVLFTRYGTGTPEAPRAAAHLYWAWRSAAGDRSSASLLRSAAERYPLTFYGGRARARLGLPAIAPVPAGRRRDLDSTRFERPYEELAALGFDVEALEEVESQLADDSPEPLREAAAELIARRGDTSRAIAIAQPLIDAALYGRRPLGGTLWRVGYPRAFLPLIVREAGRHGLDPLLVLALIREESRFDPWAVSPANAVGLMQLLPSTARGVLGRPVGISELTDPSLNVRAGAAYLAGLLRRYQGTVPLAVAAYNAGPGGVRRHAALARTDLERFVEELPYSETRAYVQRVMQTYGIYLWLYR